MTSALPGEVHVAADPQALAVAAASWVAARVQTGRSQPHRFSIALAGGSTPQGLYQRMAASAGEDWDWAAWEVFYGDERAVPLDDDQSNHQMARTALLEHVPIPAAQIHPMPADRPDLDAASADYARLLAATLPAGAGGAPRLDVVLLGLGDDGHTASLFPGTAALTVTGTWATRGRADRDPRERVTLTYPTLNAAGAVAFLVTGEGKRAALRGVVDGVVPAAGVRPTDGDLHWFLDAAAAGTS